MLLDPIEAVYIGDKAYLASCNVHDKIHRGKIIREGETVLHELKDGESR